MKEIVDKATDILAEVIQSGQLPFDLEMKIVEAQEMLLDLTNNLKA